MKTWTLRMISEWLHERGGGLYGGEAVTQQAHALQCATRALADGATQALIMAAFLHDIGHLSDCADDRRHPHEQIAARMLSGMFPPAVTEPIRLHVDAKQYLCAAEPLYGSAEAGCYKLMLSSNLKRMDAHRFYERLGFSQHGVGFSILLP